MKRVVQYGDGVNYWFGSGHQLAPPPAELVYVVWDPINVSWNGNVIVLINSGGFRSSTAEQVLGSTGFDNRIAPILKYG